MKTRHAKFLGVAAIGVLAGLAVATTSLTASEASDVKQPKSHGATAVSLVKLPSSAGGVGIGLTKLAPDAK